VACALGLLIEPVTVCRGRSDSAGRLTFGAALIAGDIGEGSGRGSKNG
jgi:hypothetical protein